MKITALDIRKQEFARSFRGYDPVEVDSFLQVIATGWQEMVDDLRRSQEKIDEQRMKLEHYMKVEEALEQALQTARSSARQTIESAEKKAGDLLEDAENRIVELQKEADASRLEIKRETARYAVRQQEIVAKLRSFLVSEMEMLRHFEADTSERTLAQPSARREIEMYREDPAPAEDPEALDDAPADPEQSVTEDSVADEAQPEEDWQDEPGETDEVDELETVNDLSSDNLYPEDNGGEDWSEEEDYDDADDEADYDGYDEEAAHEEDEDVDSISTDASAGWTVTPVFESASDDADDIGSSHSQGGEGLPDDSADDEIKKIHEILKGLDEEQDNEEID